MTDEQYEQATSFWIRKDAEAKAMDKDAIWKWIDGFLSSHKVLALATGAGDYVRCTPLEYSWHDGAFWVFTEGGLKFKALRENKRVAAAVFDANASFGELKSAQVEGRAELPEPFSEEYVQAAKFRGIPLSALEKLEEPMWLLKIVPREITCLDSGFKKNGFGSRQTWKA